MDINYQHAFGMAPVGMALSSNRSGTYADDRIMRRLDGRFKGEAFWCHVSGRALKRDAPHKAGEAPIIHSPVPVDAVNQL